MLLSRRAGQRFSFPLRLELSATRTRPAGVGNVGESGDGGRVRHVLTRQRHLPDEIDRRHDGWIVRVKSFSSNHFAFDVIHNRFGRKPVTIGSNGIQAKMEVVTE